MRTGPAVVRKRTEANEKNMNVKELIRRVKVLMNDERYPPLYIQKVDLKISN
jgi:hypothetical protein